MEGLSSLFLIMLTLRFSDCRKPKFGFPPAETSGQDLLNTVKGMISQLSNDPVNLNNHPQTHNLEPHLQTNFERPQHHLHSPNFPVTQQLSLSAPQQHQNFPLPQQIPQLPQIFVMPLQTNFPDPRHPRNFPMLQQPNFPGPHIFPKVLQPNLPGPQQFQNFSVPQQEDSGTSFLKPVSEEPKQQKSSYLTDDEIIDQALLELQKLLCQDNPELCGKLGLFESLRQNDQLNENNLGDNNSSACGNEEDHDSCFWTWLEKIQERPAKNMLDTSTPKSNSTVVSPEFMKSILKWYKNNRSTVRDQILRRREPGSPI